MMIGMIIAMLASWRDERGLVTIICLAEMPERHLVSRDGGSGLERAKVILLQLLHVSALH